MLVKQSKNSFIRCTERYGYITNQLTRQDRCYNESGAEWLKMITRVPRDVNEIIDVLIQSYDAPKEIIIADFNDFLDSLVKAKFVVVGETAEELEEKDESFTYNVEIPTTLARDFTQETTETVSEHTQDFFMEEMQGHPLISNLQFELSSRCNERCIHCYIPNAKKNKGFDMPLEKVKSIIDEFSAMGGIHVTLSGGEALMHKNLLEIARYCREKDLKISILSNLILLTDEHVKALKDLNLSIIQVSLYSMDPKVHDFITTVKGSFTRTKQAIEKLVAADIPVQISCPIMKANREGYREVLDYAASLKIRANTDFIMMARADLDTENLANRISIEETEILLRDIIEQDYEYRNKTLQRSPLSEEINKDRDHFLTLPVCGVGYDNCCVAANGDVYPCAGWQDYVLGNVYKQSLAEIWENSERIKNLRKITQASFPQCVDCEAGDYCARCLVRNYNESGGDMFAVNNHFCNVAFLTKKLVEEYKEKGLL